MKPHQGSSSNDFSMGIMNNITTSAQERTSNALYPQPSSTSSSLPFPPFLLILTLFCLPLLPLPLLIVRMSSTYVLILLATHRMQTRWSLASTNLSLYLLSCHTGTLFCLESSIFSSSCQLVPLPSHMQARGCEEVFQVKENSDGSINKNKAQLVAKGFHQHGFDYKNTFSPVVKPVTIRDIILL